MKQALGLREPVAIDELLAAGSATRVRGTTLYLQRIQDHLTDTECPLGDDALLNACRQLTRLIRERTDGPTPSLTGLLDLVQLTVLLLKRRFESLDRDADLQLDCNFGMAQTPPTALRRFHRHRVWELL